jgi:hypothetical protein
MRDQDDARLLAIAELNLEAKAALASDWEEARFRSVRINTLVFDLGSQRVTCAQADLDDFLADRIAEVSGNDETEVKHATGMADQMMGESMVGVDQPD